MSTSKRIGACMPPRIDPQPPTAERRRRAAMQCLKGVSKARAENLVSRLGQFFPCGFGFAGADFGREFQALMEPWRAACDAARRESFHERLRGMPSPGISPDHVSVPEFTPGRND